MPPRRPAPSSRSCRNPLLLGSPNTRQGGCSCMRPEFPSDRPGRRPCSCLPAAPSGCTCESCASRDRSRLTSLRPKAPRRPAGSEAPYRGRPASKTCVRSTGARCHSRSHDCLRKRCRECRPAIHFAEDCSRQRKASLHSQHKHQELTNTGSRMAASPSTPPQGCVAPLWSL